ncbi:uncharacterized protein LOC129322631 [Prosopis cineraria]|uniref:uncharacterized protein LOC129322631 n=1 Tax=Prosopis cineraria TaxID=364024 RepID=UPI00240FF3F1|nr:uncharacterized protein LOC129322631 [Prosopis cineraria]
MSSSASILHMSSSPVSSPSHMEGYIQHPVSNLDTLAGIAIKYGVEVADVKEMNGLVTDQQMFALKFLHIPLPGRHPPFPSFSNGVDNTVSGPSNHAHCELFESFKSLKVTSPQQQVSLAMCSLQGFCGLKPTDKKSMCEGLEMAEYRKGGFGSSENGSFSRNSAVANRSLGRHRKSKSLVDVILNEIAEQSDNVPATEAGKGGFSNWNGDKLFLRHQKSVGDFTHTQELLLREDRNISIGGFSSRTGKCLAQRQKAASRPALTNDSDGSGLTSVPAGLKDAYLGDVLSGVRKSSSTSCLNDQDNSFSSSIWPTSMWSLKPDLQALSTAAISKPIFDSLPMTMSGRPKKDALD